MYSLLTHPLSPFPPLTHHHNPYAPFSHIHTHARKKVVVLVGHSFGAYIAVKYTRRHPHHPCRLVLLAPAGLLPTAGVLGYYWSWILASGIIQTPRLFGVMGARIVLTIANILRLPSFFHSYYLVGVISLLLLLPPSLSCIHTIPPSPLLSLLLFIYGSLMPSIYQIHLISASSITGLTRATMDRHDMVTSSKWRGCLA